MFRTRQLRPVRLTLAFQESLFERKQCRMRPLAPVRQLRGEALASKLEGPIARPLLVFRDITMLASRMWRMLAVTNREAYWTQAMSWASFRAPNVLDCWGASPLTQDGRSSSKRIPRIGAMVGCHEMMAPRRV